MSKPMEFDATTIGKLVEDMVGGPLPIGSRVEVRIAITAPEDIDPPWLHATPANADTIAIKVRCGEYRTMREMRDLAPVDCDVYYRAPEAVP